MRLLLRAVCGVSFALLGACVCVSLPGDRRFACLDEGGCLPGYLCQSGFCERAGDVLCLTGECEDDGGVADAGPPGAGRLDGGELDAGAFDGGSGPADAGDGGLLDAGQPDAGLRDAGLGEVDCANGADDEGDSLRDCDDPDCEARRCSGAGLAICCGGTCVDASGDPENCGGCGSKCEPSRLCMQFPAASGVTGACACLGDGCPAGQTCATNGVCTCSTSAGCSPGSACVASPSQQRVCRPR
jgi:hypothetical protein